MNTEEYLTIGKYPQKNKVSSDPIEWRILNRDDRYALLISRYALITSPYCDLKLVHEDLKYQEWRYSVAREACGRFFDEAFSESEKARIPLWKTVNGDDFCEDRVFLLSEEQLLKFMPEPQTRKAMPTECAIAAGARLGWTEDTKAYTSWWVLPENNPMRYGKIFSASHKEYHREIYPKAVFQNGEIEFHSRNCYHSDFTIRPCILYRLDENDT